MAFRPGTTILLQEIWRGRVWSARPMRVVEDDGDRAALWFPKGTLWMAPTTPPYRPRAGTRGERLMASLELGDWVHAEFPWDVSSIWLVEPGVSHAVWVSWREDGSHLGWYVNLQEPFVRTDRGFKYMDLMLDVVVNPDRSWYWKDEDEFALMVKRGLISRERARVVRAAGRVVLEQ
ncbi:MAG: DUF402 domain-containing protein, partial [Dehalococcoidia bacterium]